MIRVHSISLVRRTLVGVILGVPLFCCASGQEQPELEKGTSLPIANVLDYVAACNDGSTSLQRAKDLLNEPPRGKRYEGQIRVEDVREAMKFPFSVEKAQDGAYEIATLYKNNWSYFRVTDPRQRQKAERLKKGSMVRVIAVYTETENRDNSNVIFYGRFRETEIIDEAQGPKEGAGQKGSEARNLEKEVLGVVTDLNRCWTTGRTDELARFFHPDMVAVTPADRLPLVGGGTCAAAWKAYADSTTIRSFHAADYRVRVFGNAAVVTYTFEMECEQGGKTFMPSGRDMMLLVREDGKWWLVADQFSAYPIDADKVVSPAK